jgi:hypothetical protein
MLILLYVCPILLSEVADCKKRDVESEIHMGEYASHLGALVLHGAHCSKSLLDSRFRGNDRGRIEKREGYNPPSFLYRVFGGVGCPLRVALPRTIVTIMMISTMPPTTMRAISPASRPEEEDAVIVVVAGPDVVGVVIPVVVAAVVVAVVVVGVVVTGGGPNSKTMPLAPAAYMLLAELPQTDASVLVVPLVMPVQAVPS